VARTMGVHQVDEQRLASCQPPHDIALNIEGNATDIKPAVRSAHEFSVAAHESPRALAENALRLSLEFNDGQQRGSEFGTSLVLFHGDATLFQMSRDSIGTRVLAVATRQNLPCRKSSMAVSQRVTQVAICAHLELEDVFARFTAKTVL